MPEGISVNFKDLFRKIGSQFRRISFFWDLTLTLGILLILTFFIVQYGLDIYVQSLFYDVAGNWYLSDTPFFSLLYDYGEIPAWIFFIASLVLLLLSFVPNMRKNFLSEKKFPKIFLFFKNFKKYRRSCFFAILLMLIGPGLIVNAVLKEHMGRPRPREIVQFGGEHEFVEAWIPGSAGQNSSFPSGHSSVAFYLFFPFFIFRHKKKMLANFFLILGVFYGSLMGLTRISQGGHFLSDVIWSGGLVYLSGLFLYYLLGMEEKV